MSETDRAARAAASTAAIAALFLIAQQVAGKATRDALFLSAYPATDLPMVMIAAAVVALIVVLSMSRLMSRWSPRALAPLFMIVNAGLFALEWSLVTTEPRATAMLVYLHTAGTGAAVVSAFWSMMNERFDPHTARRVMSRIAAGATAGGVIGGVAAWQLAELTGLRSMLAALAGLNVAAAAVSWVVGPPSSTRNEPVDGDSSGSLRVLKDTPYLRQMALLVTLAAAGEAAIDYVFKASASASFESAESLVMFFGLFHTATGVATFVLQAAFTRRSLANFGLAGTIAFWPGAVVAGAIAALAAPVLGTVTALRGGAGAVQNSLYRSGYELLYTPLPPAKKRATKTLIDVGCEKLGSAAGSGIALVAVLAIPAAANLSLLGVALAAAIVTLLIARSLHHGYVTALADSLKSGAVQLEEDALIDATTRRTMADTMALDRQQLLADIESLRRAAGASFHAMPAQRSATPRPTVSADDPVEDQVADLRSGDPERVRARLDAARPLPVELVGHAIPLLADDNLVPAVLRALRTAAPRATGQLIDAMLDRGVDVRVRRRIPRVLRVCKSQRAVDGLVEALSDDAFELRFRAAAALLRITSRSPELRVDEHAVMTAARAAAARGEGNLIDTDDEATEFERDAAARALSRTLTYVFMLLAHTVEREPLHLALCALGSDDPGLRGTGLEYLDNVLAPDLRAALGPHLADRELAKRSARPRTAIMDELMASRDSLVLDPDVARKLRGG